MVSVCPSFNLSIFNGAKEILLAETSQFIFLNSSKPTPTATGVSRVKSSCMNKFMNKFQFYKPGRQQSQPGVSILKNINIEDAREHNKNETQT